MTGYTPIAKLGQKIDDSDVWGKKYSVDTQLVEEELTKNRGISLYDIDSNFGEDLVDDTTVFKNFNLDLFFHQNGLIGPTGNGKNYVEYQYNRKFSFNAYIDEAFRSFLDDLGPLFIGRGEKNKVYSDPARYKFNNTLGNILSEKNLMDQSALFDGINADDDDYCQILSSVNSIGNNCFLFVDGSQKTLEELQTTFGFNGDLWTDQALMVEFTRTLANQYGGNTYEARSKNAYMRIGNYQPISTTEVTIENAGDTFVSNFRFARILPNSSKVYSPKYTSICEIIEFPVESSIDLNSRNDYSVDGWNSIFHPSYDEYHNYNRVYSQEPIATTNTSNIFTFKAVKSFNNKITTTKAKTSGELVDSWTDILVNEELLLDGRYGRLNKLVSNNGTMYAFQDKAIAALQIQPRIQQVTSDGLGVELGTGSILYNYTYITTESGSVNKRCIFTSPSSIYYLDLLNKTVNKISPNGLEGLSTSRGMQSYFNGVLDYSTLKFSNSAHGGFDNNTDDAYFTVKDNFTIAFNERTNNFTSFYGFNAANIYIKDKSKFYSSNNSYKLFEHGANDYGVFYEEDAQDSYITLLCAPNSFGESIMYSLEFMAELRDENDADVFFDGTNYTIPLKSIHVFNDYQDSTNKDLVYKTNIFRRFRNWAIQIPKDSVKKYDFIRGKWAKIKLTIDNSENNTLVLHDIILNYNSKIPLH